MILTFRRIWDMSGMTGVIGLFRARVHLRRFEVVNIEV